MNDRDPEDYKRVLNAVLGVTTETLQHEALVGKELRAADGGDYGVRVLSYHAGKQDYLVQPIRWSTRKPLPRTEEHPEFPGDESPRRIDRWKITYRYAKE